MVKGLISKEPIKRLKNEDMVRMNIGPRFWPVTFDKIPDECSHKEPLRKWIANAKYNLDNGIGILFYGNYGRGKTSSAVLCAKHTAMRGGSAYMVRGNQLRDAIINQTQFDADDTVKTRALTVDLLILDDLGAEHDTSFGMSTIEEILRERSDHKRATIITTNLSGDTLKQKIGESLTSFLSASMITVLCEGNDFRAEERKDIRSN